jgi:hypothetical protein
VQSRGFAAHFHACVDEMTKKQNVGRPRGSSPDPEEAKSGRLVASDKSLRFEGLHSHSYRPRTYNNASPLCSFIIIMVVPAVFQSTRYRRRCNSVARSLTHYTEPILKHRGVFRGVFAGGVAAGRTRRALVQLQPINEQVSERATLTELHTSSSGCTKENYVCRELRENAISTQA